jgi:hypothetical protein
MDGMIGFNRELDAQSFISGLPVRERRLAELVEVEVFDGPIAAIHHVNEKRRDKIIIEDLVGVT